MKTKLVKFATIAGLAAPHEPQGCSNVQECPSWAAAAQSELNWASHARFRAVFINDAVQSLLASGSTL